MTGSRPSRAVWFSAGVVFGLGLAATLALSERASQATRRARERIAASLHGHAQDTRAQVVAPSAPPSVATVSTPAPPTVAPSDTAAPVSFIGPPAPTPSASAAVKPRGPRGFVTVVCRPACDAVRDGARLLGPSPVFKRALVVGTHHLTLVTKDPRVSRRVDVEVTEGEVASVQEEMTP